MAAETVIENAGAADATTININENVTAAHEAALGLRGLIKQWLVTPDDMIVSQDEQVEPLIADCALTSAQLDGDAAIGMEILAEIIDTKIAAALGALEPRLRVACNAGLREAHALAGALGMAFNRAVVAGRGRGLEGEEGLLLFNAVDRIAALCERWSEEMRSSAA